MLDSECATVDTVRRRPTLPDVDRLPKIKMAAPEMEITIERIDPCDPVFNCYTPTFATMQDMSVTLPMLTDVG